MVYFSLWLLFGKWGEKVVREAVRESRHQRPPAQGLWQLLHPARQSQGLYFIFSIFTLLREHSREGLSFPVNRGMRILVPFVYNSHSFPT